MALEGQCLADTELSNSPIQSDLVVHTKAPSPNTPSRGLLLVVVSIIAAGVRKAAPLLVLLAIIIRIQPAPPRIHKALDIRRTQSIGPSHPTSDNRLPATC
jgi:hypothetical protein